MKHPKLIPLSRKALGKPDDRGGNQLYYAKTQELHGLWDTPLVTKVVPSKSPETLAKTLARDAGLSKWKTSGDYHHWPETWGGDPAIAAIKAYKDIAFGPATLNETPQIERIEIKLRGGTTGYSATQRALVRTQLAKAASHLAQL